VRAALCRFAGSDGRSYGLLTARDLSRSGWTDGGTIR
jgi:hypothetical protein